MKPETISKCFRKAGILEDGMDVAARGNDAENDPFLELDACMELESLIDSHIT